MGNSIISKANILAVRGLRNPIGIQQKNAALGEFNRMFIQSDVFKNAQRLAAGFGQAFKRTLWVDKNRSFVARTHILKLVCSAIGYDGDDVLYQLEEGTMEFPGLQRPDLGNIVWKITNALERVGSNPSA
jgi:hypothetical protein